MVLSGLVAASLLSTCDAIFTSSLVGFRITIMDVVITNTYVLLTGRTLNVYVLQEYHDDWQCWFQCYGNKGASTKGHFTLLQLKTSNHLTIHVVHTSALHGSSNGWHRSSRQIRHCSIAELFKVLSGISGGWCGGAIPLMWLQ